MLQSAATPPRAGPDPAGFQSRYVIREAIGAGGMGEVRWAEDKDLGRRVALKFLHPQLAGSETAKLHFVAEAQATSQLDHPGVPPVYDIGTTSDGRLYFAMKLVRGQTFQEVLQALHRGDKEARALYTRHRLVTIVERIADTLAFAHERGVIHRDIKPANIMLGAHGEVHVMDWGVAKVMGQSEDPRTTAPVATVRSDGKDGTMYGDLKGTLTYMSPEQALGNQDMIDEATDLYALGCILFECATLQPPFDPADRDLFLKVVSNELRKPHRIEGWLISKSLLGIARTAMAGRKADRYRSATEFGRALRAWQEGSLGRRRRKGESLSLSMRGNDAAEVYIDMRKQLHQTETELRVREDGYRTWAPLRAKRPLLRLRGRVREIRTRVALQFEEATKLLEAALGQHPGNKQARAALTRLWRARVKDAELASDRQETNYAIEMLKRCDDGANSEFIAGAGELRLESDVPGADVWLYRYEDRDGLSRLAQRRYLGPTPVKMASIAMGSYLAVIRKEGYRSVRYPIHIPRHGQWKGRVELRRKDEVLPGFMYVPGGPFLFGEAKGRRTVHLGDFAIQRDPVTIGQYVEFLIAMETRLGRDVALRHIPRDEHERPYVQRVGERRYRIVPRLVRGEDRREAIAKHGEDFEASLPVVGITIEDARAYCHWKTKATGKAWRLPTQKEREKAARGVDGRRFPWGELDDACLACCAGARRRRARPEAVGVFKTAESPYGMRDAAGNVWDWTSSWASGAQKKRVIKGGSWGSQTGHLRCAHASARSPYTRSPFVGLRCVHDL
ncbi:MAG: protein kinase domain-containing protein [Planctomycetota bacterium]